MRLGDSDILWAGLSYLQLPEYKLDFLLLPIIIISSTSFALNSFLIWAINYVIIVIFSIYHSIITVADEMFF